MPTKSNTRPRKLKDFSRSLPGGVLVVEDRDRHSAELVETIRMAGMEPLRARDGHEAIRLAVTKRPSVVFLDGLLPGMHGFEVARFIRHIDTEYVPYIVMVTGIYKNVKYRNEAILKYRIDEYVHKPIVPEKVLEIFETAGLTAAAERVAS